MNILYVEPYYSGSHKSWIDSYQKYSNHKVEILSLPGKKWKWRMHGAAITLANKYNNMNKKFDLVICSDMINLPEECPFLPRCFKAQNKCRDNTKPQLVETDNGHMVACYNPVIP